MKNKSIILAQLACDSETKHIPVTIQNAKISKSRGGQIQGMRLMI